MKIKVLSMKAKPVKEVKDETPLAFTRNSLSLWDLVHRVKAVKAKCTHYCRDTRARKEKGWAGFGCVALCGNRGLRVVGLHLHRVPSGPGVAGGSVLDVGTLLYVAGKFLRVAEAIPRFDAEEWGVLSLRRPYEPNRGRRGEACDALLAKVEHLDSR